MIWLLILSFPVFWAWFYFASGMYESDKLDDHLERGEIFKSVGIVILGGIG